MQFIDSPQPASIGTSTCTTPPRHVAHKTTLRYSRGHTSPVEEITHSCTPVHRAHTHPELTHDSRTTHDSDKLSHPHTWFSCHQWIDAIKPCLRQLLGDTTARTLSL